MGESMYAGAVPDELDVRLVYRDMDLLPAGALVKFQVINRGKNPEYNYRWLLYEDGRFFLARHSGDTSHWKVPFDTDWPGEATSFLETAVVADIRNYLQVADFVTQPPYQADATVEDGSFYVVTARMNEQIHEVIYEAVSSPLVEFLETIILAHG